jgi:hypothetical protein
MKNRSCQGEGTNRRGIVKEVKKVRANKVEVLPVQE